LTKTKKYIKLNSSKQLLHTFLEKTMNIVIVEDTQIHLDSAEKQRPKFSEAGHNLIIIDNLPDAFKFLTENPSEYDLGLFDLYLPRGDWSGNMLRKQDSPFESEPPEQLDAGSTFALLALQQGKKAAIVTDSTRHNNWKCTMHDYLFSYSQGVENKQVIYCDLRWYNTKDDDGVYAKNWFKAFTELTTGHSD
jgi:hypothetical protein